MQWLARCSSVKRRHPADPLGKFEAAAIEYGFEGVAQGQPMN